MKINIVTFAAALSYAVTEMQKIGVLNTDGTFNAPSPANDVALAAIAETLASDFGLVIPSKVQNLVNDLPLLIDLVK